MSASKKRFIDSLRVYVKSGNGGPGNSASRSIGGCGGSVIFQGSKQVTLADLAKRHPDRRFVAGHGTGGARRRLVGDPGRDRVVPVPAGVDVVTDDVAGVGAGAGGRRLLGRIDAPGDRLVVAQGGEGGRPSNRFLGAPGTSLSVRLDLRLLADFGFVGFPNAGKSCLMRALSRAQPKVANYPFTTLRPNIGVSTFPDGRKVTLADLPGLIEGAHVNVGLGHHFLKHVERTPCLMFVVDPFGFRFNQNCPMRTGLQTVLLLTRELELYDPKLVGKPALLVLNKIDKPGARDCAREIEDSIGRLTPETAASVAQLPEEMAPTQLVKFDEIIPASALHRINTDYLRLRLRHWLDVHAKAEQMELENEAARELDSRLDAANRERVESFV